MVSMIVIVKIKNKKIKNKLQKERIMVMGIHSSWNSDRIAANFMEKKRVYTRRPCYQNSITKTVKTSDLYIKEYGMKAYQNWLLREEEINALMNTGKYSKYEICKLRENNLRQMKAEVVCA